MNFTKIEKQIENQLRDVIDPELGSNIVELGMVKRVKVTEQLVEISIDLTTLGCPLRNEIQDGINSACGAIADGREIKIHWAEMDAQQKDATMRTARANMAENSNTRVPDDTRIIAIASGKGGVGKSSISANLAVALANNGQRVGFIDADIWGYSIPKMLGITERLQAGRKPEGSEKPLLVPSSKTVGNGRIDLVSMGLLTDDESNALMWRGLMLNRAVQHFCEDVDWDAELDTLIIDLPPGTGDVAMGMAQLLPRAEVLVVTTPSKAAQRVAVRAVSMARKSNLRVLGVVENMSYLLTPSGERLEVFSSGGGAELAKECNIKLVAQIPLNPEIADGEDFDNMRAFAEQLTNEAFEQIKTYLDDTNVPEMTGCTTRLVEQMEKMLDQKSS